MTSACPSKVPRGQISSIKPRGLYRLHVNILIYSHRKLPDSMHLNLQGVVERCSGPSQNNSPSRNGDVRTSLVW